jgi:hypothetical protein
MTTTRRTTMSIQIVEGYEVDGDGNPGLSRVTLTDDTEDLAFGPTFSSLELARDFLRWLEGNGGHSSYLRLRASITARVWQQLYADWAKERLDEDGDLKPYLRCHGCGHEWLTEERDLTCPQCGEARAMVETVGADHDA